MVASLLINELILEIKNGFSLRIRLESIPELSMD